MARIQIIGKGVVGEATGEVLSRLGNNITYYDTDPGKTDTPAPVDADQHFVCVPENAVEPALDTLASHVDPDTVHIRSTVPVGTTEQLNDSHDACIHHFPEFLRERQHIMDEWTPEFAVIGIPGEVQDKNMEANSGHIHTRHLRDLFDPLTSITETSAHQSELLKLSLNGFLSTLITYWNEIHQIASAIDANSHEIALLAREDSRVPEYGTLHGEPFGGRCLPKDLSQLIQVAEENDAQPELLKTVKNVNQKLKGVS